MTKTAEEIASEAEAAAASFAALAAGEGEGSGDPGEGSGDPGEGSGDPGQGSGDPGQGSGDPGEGSGDPGEGSGHAFAVTIGEAYPEDDATAPSWVKEVRAINRQQSAQIKQLQRENEALKKGGTSQEIPKLGTKPTLESCDYDADKFANELDQWHEQKKKVDEAIERKAAGEKKQKDEWLATLAEHGKKAQAIPVDDYSTAEEAVGAELSEVQQAIVVKGAKNSALVFYALFKHPAKLRELAGISDPVKFAFAIAEVENTMKTTTKPKPPAPDKVPTGTPGVKKGAGDAKLEQLRAEAERTGDYSKVHAHKRNLRAAK